MAAVTVNGSATSHAFTSTIGGGTAATFNYNCPAGTNCLVLIEASNSGAPAAPTAVSYNGAALTMVTGSFDSDAPGDQVSIWYLLNPATGSSDVVSITYTQTGVASCGISLVPLENVNTTTPVGTAAVNVAASEGTAASVTPTGAGANDLYIAGLNEGNTYTVTSTGTDQTNRLNFTVRGSNQAVTDTQTNGGSGFTWTIATAYWWVAAGVVFYGPSATYTGVNQLDYSTTSGANSITTTGSAGIGTLAVTAGNLLVAVGYSQNAPSCSFTDSSGNLWSPYNPSFAALNGNIGLVGFSCIATYTGTPTFTLSGSGTCSAIYVVQYDILSGGTGDLFVAQGAYQPSIGSGTGNASTGSMQFGNTSSIGVGFCFDAAGTISPTTATAGFSVTTAVWKVQQGGTVAPARQANGLVTGTMAITFTTNNPGDAVYTLGAGFSLQSPLTESWQSQGAMGAIMAQ